MKGVIFTELFDMLESLHSPTYVQELIDGLNLESKGAYTRVGTYPSCEMRAIVTKLSDKTQTPISELLHIFGTHLFTRFAEIYPQYFSGINNAYDFLASVENYIHVDVKKLYPDAELPRFEIHQHDAQVFHFTYISSNNFGNLCEGLIRGCIDYIEETISLCSKDLSPSSGAKIEYMLRKEIAS